MEKQIVSMYNEGNSTRKIAKETGISQTQIVRTLSKNNVKTRSTRTNLKLEKEIFNKYCAGESSEKIAKDYNLNGSTVCRIVKRCGGAIRPPQENKRVLNLKTDWFANIDTEAKAYFLGFLYADGGVNKSKSSFKLTLEETDEHILHTFAGLLYPTENTNERVKKESGEREKYMYINVSSVDMVKDLIRHGCVLKKTFKLTFPTHIDSSLERHFIRGFFDGDGCIPKDLRRCVITGYDAFLQEIRNVVKTQLDIDMGFRHIKKCKSPNVADITISNLSESYYFLNWMYGSSNYHLQRKYNSYLSLKEKYLQSLKPALNYGTTNVVSWSSKKLYKKYIETLSTDEKEELAQYLLGYFKDKGFPYPQFSSIKLRRDFRAVEGCLGTIVDDKIYSSSQAGLKIFKHFCPHYYSVKSKKLPSMIECFENDELLMTVIKNRIGLTYKECFNITGNMLRQGMRNSWTAFGASVFRPELAKTIYNEFANENSIVLDVSAGFGQRMLGAHNVGKYIGLDPWSETIKALTKIKDTFDLPAELHCIGSELFCPSELVNKVDFCFSSPPFFDKEIYSDDTSQAYHRTYDEFIFNWWVPTAQNVHKLLKYNSYFVLNMNDDMASDMIAEAKDLFRLERTIIDISQKRNKKDGFYVLKRI